MIVPRATSPLGLYKKTLQTSLIIYYFIFIRDELCRNGDLLHSPALNYTLLDLSNAVNAERQLKQAQEPEEEDVKPIFIKVLSMQTYFLYYNIILSFF